MQVIYWLEYYNHEKKNGKISLNEPKNSGSLYTWLKWLTMRMTQTLSHG